MGARFFASGFGGWRKGSSSYSARLLLLSSDESAPLSRGMSSGGSLLVMGGQCLTLVATSCRRSSTVCCTCSVFCFLLLGGGWSPCLWSGMVGAAGCCSLCCLASRASCWRRSSLYSACLLALADLLFSSCWAVFLPLAMRCCASNLLILFNNECLALFCLAPIFSPFTFLVGQG